MSRRSVLYDMHAARGARFFSLDSWEIPDHFGDPRAEYDSVRNGVAAFDLSCMGRLRVLGDDRVRYLHNMLSNDIRGLRDGAGCYATLLTHQGKMESDVHVYAHAGEYFLECMPAGYERLAGSLRRFIIADKVEVEDATKSRTILSLQGPESRVLMERTAGIPLSDMGMLEHGTSSRLSGDWSVVHRDRTGCDGYDLWLPSEDASAVWKEWVEEAGLQPAGHTALNWLRTEAGIPWYGPDMTEQHLPMEFGLDSAVSLTKGCYRGQEIVARVAHRGNLDRCMGGLAVEHAEPPGPGAEVRAGNSRVGEVTSAILSPRLGRPLALAILERTHLASGTALEVRAGDAFRPARVVELPLA